MRRIVCIGNCLLAQDAAGSLVYQALRARELPAGVELVDGGLAGLDLLRLVDGVEQVVFVDAVEGQGRPGQVMVLGPDDLQGAVGYGHGAGLSALLAVLPRVCQGPLPQVTLVGIEAPFDASAVAEAATLSLAQVGSAPTRLASEETPA